MISFCLIASTPSICWQLPYLYHQTGPFPWIYNIYVQLVWHLYWMPKKLVRINIFKAEFLIAFPLQTSSFSLPHLLTISVIWLLWKNKFWVVLMPLFYLPSIDLSANGGNFILNNVSSIHHLLSPLVFLPWTKPSWHPAWITKHVPLILPLSLQSIFNRASWVFPLKCKSEELTPLFRTLWWSLFYWE